MAGDFYGAATGSVGNEYLRLEYLTEAGPRVVGLRVAGSAENLLAETQEVSWPTPFGTYSVYGGHRLWHAPEAAPRSSVPDNGPLSVEELADGVRLSRPAEEFTGIAKSIEIRPLPGRPAAVLRHVLRNEGAWPVELAAWAITILPLGGVAVLPQASTVGAAFGQGPDRQMIGWPYTRWSDPRLDLSHSDCVLVRGELQPGYCKIGYFDPKGWVAYVRGQQVFRKHFTPHPALPHADRGCNAEVYVCPTYIELETLGPLTRLEPGQEIEHEEVWEVSDQAEGVPEEL